ncbi:MAG TPA: hypothetical protein VFM51_02240 [Solirubrobacterales bacterium]|nr:hypothetical protein [Solirubrobacterales bacterium]
MAWLRRAAGRRERFITAYEFPSYISRRVRKRLPPIEESDWPLVEQGMREWFICCAWRGRAVLGMPSRAVDEAWHEFILDSIAYMQFCEQAFGDYLHHTPDEAMGAPMGDALAETVRAWDRSDTGRNQESVLWDLDERLGIAEPLSLNGLQLAAARSRAHYPVGAGGCFGGTTGGDSGSSGGSCSGGGGDGAGGGCGGGGCGGGGN